jgi:uncharacterized protein YhfF
MLVPRDTATLCDVTAAELFETYRAAAGLPAETPFIAFTFGDHPDMADELAMLVRDGPKRATAGLLAAMTARDEPIPAVGDYSVVLDGRGQAVCVIRTTQTRVGALASVDEAFARDEGEGDRTRAWWIAAHERSFARSCDRLGIEWQDDLPVHFERFALVWPERQEA